MNKLPKIVKDAASPKSGRRKKPSNDEVLQAVYDHLKTLLRDSLGHAENCGSETVACDCARKDTVEMVLMLNTLFNISEFDAKKSARWVEDKFPGLIDPTTDNNEEDPWSKDQIKTM